MASVNDVSGDDITGRDVASGQAGTAGSAPARSRWARARVDRGAAPGLRPDDLFARNAREYSRLRAGEQVALLQAGCATADGDLGAADLQAAGCDVSLSRIDDSEPLTRSAVAERPGLDYPVLGDLRTVPLPPRAYDIIQCAFLLERIHHAELVLDRLTAALKPGGLLFLQFRDRECAAGFLDRVLPAPLRRHLWRKRQPGTPGPYPAVYEPLASARGVQAYALRHGLVIAERQVRGGQAGGMPGTPTWFLAAQNLVASISRGRLTSAHEALWYVLRKPENRFARILLVRALLRPAPAAGGRQPRVATRLTWTSRSV